MTSWHVKVLYQAAAVCLLSSAREQEQKVVGKETVQYCLEFLPHICVQQP